MMRMVKMKARQTECVARLLTMMMMMAAAGAESVQSSGLLFHRFSLKAACSRCRYISPHFSKKGGKFVSLHSTASHRTAQHFDAATRLSTTHRPVTALP